MWWTDLTEIKREMGILKSSLLRVECALCDLLRNDRGRAIEGDLKNIKETVGDVFCSEDENNSINRLHAKLDSLVQDADRVQTGALAEKTFDKLEDYMKKVDSLNSMIKAICEKQEKKARGKKKSVKKKAAS